MSTYYGVIWAQSTEQNNRELPQEFKVKGGKVMITDCFTDPPASDCCDMSTTITMPTCDT